jgi:hypothetical protein
MSAFEHLPAAAVDVAIALLLPLLLPFLGGDVAAAQGLARQMLFAYGPDTERELQLAGEAAAYHLKGLTLLSKSAGPDLATAAMDGMLRRACGLTRLGHQAQHRLDQLRGLRRLAVRAASAGEAPGAVPEADAAAPRQSADMAPVPVAPAQTNLPPDEVVEAAAVLASAEATLTLMKGRWKGAPPSHSPAGQQIKQQQRVVELARMKLGQARRRAEATQPDAMKAAA